MSNPHRLSVATEIFAGMIAKNAQSGFDRDQITAQARQAVRAADILLAELEGPAPAQNAIQEAPAAPAASDDTPEEGSSILEEATRSKRKP